MPNLMLGVMAKDAAKSKFRSFQITLATSGPTAGPSGMAPAKRRRLRGAPSDECGGPQWELARDGNTDGLPAGTVPCRLKFQG